MCAFVNYLHFQGQRHVVYVPSCGKPPKAPKNFLECLQFSLPEFKTRNPTWDSMADFINRQQKWSVVFVFDGWQALEKSPKGEALKDQLQGLQGRLLGLEKG